jgi:hypothetical protein
MSFPNAFASYYFAGLGFTQLNVDTGTIKSGTLLDQTFSQLLTNISYDNTTGKISFAVAESPINIRAISFVGNAITDASGTTVVGFSGTWTGERVVVVKGAEAAQGAKRAPTVVPGGPPSGLNVEGYWSAAIMPLGIP